MVFGSETPGCIQGSCFAASSRKLSGLDVAWRPFSFAEGSSASVKHRKMFLCGIPLRKEGLWFGGPSGDDGGDGDEMVAGSRKELAAAGVEVAGILEDTSEHAEPVEELARVMWRAWIGLLS